MTFTSTTRVFLVLFMLIFGYEAIRSVKAMDEPKRKLETPQYYWITVQDEAGELLFEVRDDGKIEYGKSYTPELTKKYFAEWRKSRGLPEVQ